jgi:coproporphyrinogen III oxidase-like Fe-S oxidoreductase
MEPATVAALIEAARRHWPADDDIEITLEANPNSVEAARFADLAAAGVNRLSLGLQSFDDEALAFLGRAHSASEGLSALEIAQRISSASASTSSTRFPATRGELVGRARPALSLGTTHLSLYQLTIEPGTRFAALHRGKLEPLDPDAPPPTCSS